MLPLFAYKHPKGYIATTTVGPITLETEHWVLALLACSVVMAMISTYFAWWVGRWWLTAVISTLALVIVHIVLARRNDVPESVCLHRIAGVDAVLFPLVVVHAVVSLTMPRPPAEPPRRYNSL
jgi:hypothetical protein